MKQRGGSNVARQHQRLLIGPWSHGVYTSIFPERNYGLMASSDAIDLVGVQLCWYNHWLKGEDNGVEQDKPVKLFVMGLDQWREEDDWPLPDTQFRPYYLHSAGHANTATGMGRFQPRHQQTRLRMFTSTICAIPSRPWVVPFSCLLP